MPINNQLRSQQITVGGDDQKLSRPGGSASKASARIAPDRGGAFTDMEKVLLTGKAPDAEKLSGNQQPSRQYNKLASGGEAKGAVRSPQAFSQKIDKQARRMDSVPAEGRAKKVSVRLFKKVDMSK